MRQVPESDDYEFAAAMLGEYGLMMARLHAGAVEFNGRTVTKEQVREINERGVRACRLADAIRSEHVTD